jgi:phage/plasmid primase-like uncharacterized protein
MSDSSHPSRHSQEDAFSAPQDAGKHRFFFDTYDGETLVEDTDGLELESLKAARQQTQAALADMVRDVQPTGNQRTLTIRVRNEGGETVLRAAVSIMLEMRS